MTIDFDVWRRRAQADWPAALALVLAACFAAWLARSYVGAERLIYFWDNAFYHRMATDLWEAWRQGGLGWLRRMGSSLQQDYNGLFTLPTLLSFRWFGSGRATYVGTVAVLGVVGWAWCAALVARGSLAAPRPGWGLVLAAFALALLLTPPWQATLAGYPDIGGALLITAAVLVYLRDPGLSRWRTVLWMGLLAGGAVLFRRHFAYAVVALYGSVGLLSLAEVLRARPPGPLFRHYALRLAGGLVPATLLLPTLLAPRFFWRALTNDYNALYAGYQRSALEVCLFLGWQVGGLVFLLALLGFLLAWRRGRVAGRTLAFWGLLTGLWVTLWATVVRQVSPQYVLHVLPLVLVVGLLLLADGVEQLVRRRVLPVVVAVLAVLQAVWLLPSATGNAPLLPGSVLWPAQVAPSQGHAQDYQTYRRLAAWLRNELPAGARLYVVGSSGALNDDIGRSLLDHAGISQQVHRLMTPHIDSRDFLPVHSLVLADHLLVASPAQYHMEPERQRVVGLVVDALAAEERIVQDFAPVGEAIPFVGNGGFQVRLYRRIRPAEAAVVVAEIDREMAALGRRPGSQADWLALHPDYYVAAGDGGLARLVGQYAAASDGGHAYVHVQPLSGRVRVEARLKPAEGCAPQLGLGWLLPDGRSGELAALSADPQALRWEGDLPAGAHLVLQARLGRAGCRMDLRDVAVHAP